MIEGMTYGIFGEEFMMPLINSFIKSIILSIIIVILCFANTPVKNNNEYNTTKDIEIMKFTLDRVKKSYLELEQKYDECEDKRKKNVIADFDFSKKIFDKIDILSWIITYDTFYYNKCIRNSENNLLRQVYAFKEMEKEFGTDYNLTFSDDYSYTGYMLLDTVNTYNMNQKLPLSVRKYLDLKLGKLFDGHRLREAYKAYLKKQKRK